MRPRTGTASRTYDVVAEALTVLNQVPPTAPYPEYRASMVAFYESIARMLNERFDATFTADQVERLETTALGHVDYVTKYALNLADVIDGRT